MCIILVADMWIFVVVVCRVELAISRTAMVVFVTSTLIWNFAADIDGVVSLSVWAAARTTDESYSNSRLGREIYLFCRSLTPSPGPIKPSVQCVLLALFRWLKRTEHELDQPHPCGVHIKNECISEPTPSCSFVTCTGIILLVVQPN